MDDDYAEWARISIRLVLILHALMPKDADEYARAVERADAVLRATDWDLDELLMTDAPLRMLIGKSLAEQMCNLPPDIKYAHLR